jgi:hypothetical protein
MRVPGNGAQKFCGSAIAGAVTVSIIAAITKATTTKVTMRLIMRYLLFHEGGAWGSLARYVTR